MKHDYLLFCVLTLLWSNPTFAQDLDFATSSPVYPNGATSHAYSSVGSPAVNVSVSISGGSFTNNTPKPASTGLQTNLNFTNVNDTRTYNFAFSEARTGLTFDIRALQYNTSSASAITHYQDKITILATDASGNPVALTVPAGAGYSITGNEILATSSSAVNVPISFAAGVKNLTIVYGNGPLAGSNPGAQGFTIGDMSWTGAVLPVEFAYFRGKPIGNVVQLGWETVWEHNTSHFVVEHSVDIRSFVPVGKVLAAGQTSQRQSYSFVHDQAQRTINYYRLQQVDLDGTVQYSKIIAVTADAPSSEWLIYPNPSDGRIIYIAWNDADPSTLQISTLTGRPISFRPTRLGNGDWMLEPNEPLPTGIYLIRARGVRPTCLLVR